MNILKIITTIFNKNKRDKKDIIIEELTKKEEKKDKLLLTSMWVFLTIILVFFVVICWMASTYIPSSSTQLMVVVVSCILLLISCFYILKLEVEAGYYECKKCLHRHKPEYSKVLCSMHIGTTRYLRCPKCNKKSWSKKVLSK